MTSRRLIADPDLRHAEPSIDFDRGVGVVGVHGFDRQVRRRIGPEVDLVLAANSRLIGEVVGLIALDPALLRPAAEGRRSREDARDIELLDEHLDDQLTEPFFSRSCGNDGDMSHTVPSR